jgi:hypothetical protein
MWTTVLVLAVLLWKATRLFIVAFEKSPRIRCPVLLNVKLPDVVTEVNVPTLVILGCAAVVTVPAVVAAPVNAPTKVVDVTLDSPATVVVVVPSAKVVLPKITFEFANLACASVPLEILLALSAVSAEPLPVNTPVLAVNAGAVIVPLEFNPVSVPTLVI